MMSPGLIDLSMSRMIPLIRLDTTFCKPKPIPTPSAPLNTAMRRQVDADAGQRDDDCEHDQGRLQQFAEQDLHRGRQVGQPLDMFLQNAGQQHGRPQQDPERQHALQDSQQRNPQAAERDGEAVEQSSIVGSSRSRTLSAATL